MKRKEHRPGVSEVNLVARHVKLEGIEQDCIDAVVSEIDQLYGLDEVSYDEESHVLNIAYDASHMSLDDIEAVLRQHNIDLSHDWWTHFKEGYYKFVDQNVKDNVSHHPWSCHNPPPTGRKR